MSLRHYIFLKEVFLFALTAFGGPQAHFAMMFDIFVHKRRYLSEQELIELNALCQILPGPTSTQTITAIGFRLGGPTLAYLTLLVWVLPGVSFMTLAAIAIHWLEQNGVSLHFTKFIQPIAVGFVAFAAYRISFKVINSRLSIFLMVVAAVVSYYIRTPFVFPALLLAAGVVTAFDYKQHPKEVKAPFKVNWSNFLLWAGVLIAAAVVGHYTRWLPVRLFENFYRNGSLIFGGGQVLVPLMYTEFVEFKRYLTSEEFLTGFGIAQSLPGPTFSFAAYIGAMSMQKHGLSGELLGGLVAAAGIFLPGTFLIFFVIRFWTRLKQYRPVKASLVGINAASAGLVIGAAILLFEPIESTPLNIGFILLTFGLLLLTRVPSFLIVLVGLLAGFLL
ncbi:chromate efflux transporter [Cesiribacter andamanensis]|uniref:Chromate transporter, chromate ion transporter (CHR) family n=1 Tax=Cesiribacter andamanensis AMV16 TaxID=1279009 RepID=M7NZM6_9BACT|nr:chromate efflux transporter [Cesiribacter andamanensis]EMR03794.1 chromate transporter, chromate ion transporter (CHR) family [Cesiribacter andamanensis AMV16]